VNYVPGSPGTADNITATTMSVVNGKVNIGSSFFDPVDLLHVNGLMRVTTLGSAGSTQLCRNASNQIATCSSSFRYKSNVDEFRSGLDIVQRLRPVSFDWKEGGVRDLGLGAEDVAEIEPLLVTYNSDGQVEGVKYDRIGVVLLNAVKEQQSQIEQQQKQIEEQRALIDGLRAAVCRQDPNAVVCRAARGVNDKVQHSPEASSASDHK
jgi:hypothetical protein